MFCTSCGGKLSDDSVFCSNCGKQISTDITAPIGEKNTEQQKVQGTKQKLNPKIKAILIIVLIGIALILVVRSCTGGGSSQQSLIVGEWRTNWGETWTFQRNGRVQVRDGFESVSGTFNISSDNTLTVTLIFPDGNDEMIFVWAENENVVGRWEWFITQDRLSIDGIVLARR